ncbi:MAG TPA: phosphatidylserine decarboxylase [Vicinamibacterales bacterium]|jgi:phosphatidylserine decarboxylase
MMRIDKAGVPFIAGALIPAAALGAAKRVGWAAGFGALAAFFAYFFRDPDRSVPSGEGLVVAPADGRVMFAGPAGNRDGPPGRWTQITIFLSPIDVHINRTPVEGRVTRIEYRPGRFLPAYKPDASQNELNEIWIDRGGDMIVVRQVVGMLARRIVCRVAEGQTLARGERIGLMKFGSRMDVFLPVRAALVATVGQHVVGGETVLARL